MSFKARCRREEWREFTQENLLAAGAHAPARHSNGRNEILVRCDAVFTDGDVFTEHMRTAHRVHPVQGSGKPSAPGRPADVARGRNPANSGTPCFSVAATLAAIARRPHPRPDRLVHSDSVVTKLDSQPIRP